MTGYVANLPLVLRGSYVLEDCVDLRRKRRGMMFSYSRPSPFSKVRMCETHEVDSL